jgi:hypothetical protein
MEINITIMVLLSATLHPLWNAMIKKDACPEGAFVGNGAMLVLLAGVHSLIAGHDPFGYYSGSKVDLHGISCNDVAAG